MKTLVEAIESGDTGAVWQLAQDGTALEAIDEATELTPLALAAEAGQAEIVRILLEAGADPNLGGATTPLEAAVVEGHLEVVEALIAASVDVNRKVEEGFTPLMTAAATGNLQLVQVLVDAGARPRLRNDEGRTAISIAEEAGHDRVVEALRTADRQQRAETRAEAEAAEAGEPAPASEDDAEEEVVDRDGGGDRDDVDSDRLAEGGAADGPGVDGGETEVESAETEAEAPAEERGPESSADDAGDTILDLLGGDGDALDIAPAAGGVDEIFNLEELVFDDIPEEPAIASGVAGDEGAGDSLSVFAEIEPARPVEAPAEDPEPSRSVASDARPAVAAVDTIEDSFSEALGELARLLEEGDPEKIRKHLASPAIAEPDEAGRTALMAAASLGDPALVKALIDAGSEVNACDRTETGHSPLIYAVNSPSLGRLEVISILVNAGANLDLRCGRNQRTALMHAAESDVYLDREQGSVFAQTTKKLIELGADLEITDRRGRTVWHLIKRDALGAPTSSESRRRLHQMLRVLEYMGARTLASHQV